jgi:hypothetical protein
LLNGVLIIYAAARQSHDRSIRIDPHAGNPSESRSVIAGRAARRYDFLHKPAATLGAPILILLNLSSGNRLYHVGEAPSAPRPSKVRKMGAPEIIGLLLLLLPPGAAPASVQAKDEVALQSPRGGADAAVVYRFRSGLDGHEEQWAIYPDGVITRDREAAGTLLPETVAELLDEIAKSGFFEMRGKYPAPSVCHQCSTHRITVRYMREKKAVSFGYGSRDLPAKLVEILSSIQALLRSARTR